MQLSPGTSGRHRPQVPRLLGLLDVMWITQPQHEAIETGPESQCRPCPRGPHLLHQGTGRGPVPTTPGACGEAGRSGWRRWASPSQSPPSYQRAFSAPGASCRPLTSPCLTCPFISSASRGAGLRARAAGATGEERDHNLGCGHTFS